MHPVKNRLAAVPVQASGNVVSTVNLSTGKQDAESAGEDGAVVRQALEKKAARLRSQLADGLQTIEGLKVWQEREMRAAEVKTISPSAHWGQADR